ncbi:inositol monophosphatase family protein [Bacillus sp. FJAT-45350]|uniref:inositol monophosphatase family protein n=1 Tax=Bacillus sp. FJAT-45350 TaxID=2011014 RepID=UPI000BB8B0C4|nr:inositol monophosphatase family protein [Bacillus sp. FJAT-45350]
MNEIDWFDVEKIAKDWVKEAGQLLKESMLQTIEVESKSNPDDLVTEMDRRIERYFLNKINERFPNHQFLGEEGSGEVVESEKGIVWIVDPIDGTTNFVHQKYNFAISLAVYENGIGKIGLIYNVMADELFSAVKGNGAYLNDTKLPKLAPVSVEKAIIGLNARWLLEEENSTNKCFKRLVESVRGVRSYGSAAIEICYVVAGRLDGYISLGLSPWDFAAGTVLLEEVNGCYSTFDGKPLNILKSSSVFVGKPKFHDEIIKDFVQKELGA